MSESENDKILFIHLSTLYKTMSMLNKVRLNLGFWSKELKTNEILQNMPIDETKFIVEFFDNEVALEAINKSIRELQNILKSILERQNNVRQNI